MGFKYLDLKMPTNFSKSELKEKISKRLHTKEFSYTLEKQSLDARKKNDIFWNLRVGVSSKALKGESPPDKKRLVIPYKKRKKKIVVVGSGPAGFFAAMVLVEAGFEVTLLEQGSDVDNRLKKVNLFEQSGQLNEKSNYTFGEGGAGTFSDGKLTSRTKSVTNAERHFIFNSFIRAGGPKEIAYMSYPHLGSDNLIRIVKRLRLEYLEKKGNLIFDTKVKDILIKNGKLTAVETEKGRIEAHYFIFAMGHSSYETYGMLIKRGIPFRVKPFAIGCRVEHPQELINRAQWGTSFLPGVKAAEYRLQHKSQTGLPVYSFCMCPGGKIVPSTAYKNSLSVNGMSNYLRNSPLANAAIVVGLDLRRLLKRELPPLEALDWLKRLEEKFYSLSNSYSAPAIKISNFINNRSPSLDFMGRTSYPFGIYPADFNHVFPQSIKTSLKQGMKSFCRKLKGWEEGMMIGLESKTSSPVQALRLGRGQSLAQANLYITGEGSGYTGGIISSAADGLKAAMQIIELST
jgi:uncharacterized FAD-dependent dehydrogenase